LLAFATRDTLSPQSDWDDPFPPHRIADRLYYVGSQGLASYLVTTTMTFTPILAHGGGMVALALVVFVTSTLLVTGFVIVITSKTDLRWTIGASVCLLALIVLLVSFACFSKITRFLGLE
jgi:hypothetical protein